MSKKVLNTMWLEATFPKDRDDKEVEILNLNMRNALVKVAKDCEEQRVSADCLFWMDFDRHSESELEDIGSFISENAPSIKIRNLRDIEEYQDNELFQNSDLAETKTLKSNLIWRQVDLAKVIILRDSIAEDKGGYDFALFTDIDIGNAVELFPKSDSKKIVVGLEEVRLENQVFGFSVDRSDLLQKLYEITLKDTTEKGLNGWHSLKAFLKDIKGNMSPYRNEIKELAVETNRGAIAPRATVFKPEEPKPLVAQSTEAEVD